MSGPAPGTCSHGLPRWDRASHHVVRSLPSGDRDQATILAGSYSQAAALNVLRADPVPRAVSGHMTYFLWGPEPGRGDVLIAYGLPRELLERHYGACASTARIVAPHARPWDTNLPVYVCRTPRGTMADLWPDVRMLGTTPASRGARPSPCHTKAMAEASRPGPAQPSPVTP
jgi:hypothetical protein